MRVPQWTKHHGEVIQAIGGKKLKNSGLRFEALRIALFATAAAIVYGVLHDLVTAHLCLEYFTIAHPPVFATESPFLLALGWGVIASWWVGLGLGLALATAARIGSWPKIGLHELRRPMIALMVASGGAALLAGLVGASLFGTQFVAVPGDWEELIPPNRQRVFTAVAYAHNASYACGALGGLLVIGRTAWRRWRANLSQEKAKAGFPLSRE